MKSSQRESGEGAEMRSRTPGLFIWTSVVGGELLQPRYEHVHHADIVSIIEQARLAFLVALNLPIETLLARDLLLVIAALEIRYLREVLAGEIEVSVEQVSLEPDGRTLVLHQRLSRPNPAPLGARGSGGEVRKKVAVEATVKLVFMDGKRRCGIPPPEDFLEALRNFNELGAG